MTLNTENAQLISGAATWYQRDFASFQLRNSGGIVNVSGSVFIHSILVVPASGRYQDATASGVVLAVNHATSGMFAQLSGDQLFRYDGAAQSGLSTANQVYTFAPLVGLNFLARSGIVTLNSGTHVYDIIVTYETRAA